MLLGPPSHPGYPFLLASPLCKMLLFPSTSAQGSARPDRARCPGHQGLLGRSPLTPRMPPVWTTLSTKQMGLVQSCQNPDLQDPGNPWGHCPISWAPHVTNTTAIAPAPFVQGEGAVSLTSPSPLLGSPRERSLWPSPRPGCYHPSTLYPPALHRRTVYAGAAGLTMLSFPALLLLAELGARSRE